MSPSKVLTSFHQRREFDVSRGESSVTETVFIEVGGGRVSFTKLSTVGGGRVSLTSYMLL